MLTVEITPEEIDIYLNDDMFVELSKEIMAYIKETHISLDTVSAIVSREFTASKQAILEQRDVETYAENPTGGRMNVTIRLEDAQRLMCEAALCLAAILLLDFVSYRSTGGRIGEWQNASFIGVIDKFALIVGYDYRKEISKAYIELQSLNDDDFDQKLGELYKSDNELTDDFNISDKDSIINSWE